MAKSVETFTFLFTDIEGSTALLERLGDEGYARVLEIGRASCRERVCMLV